ncbi:hypothetical protein TNCV_1907871 [Trichonephila clavipes]|nr:hypothetical protein TNCV_1907871 [Trichonephila clavipes]
MSSSPVPLKTYRVEARCTLNLWRAQTSSLWCGVVVKSKGCQLRISAASLLHDYAACKRSLECLFGLGALSKLKFQSMDSHRQSSGGSLWGGNWVSKLPSAIGVPPIGCRIKKRY